MKKKTILVIFAALFSAPIIGFFIPGSEIVFPLARAFRMPVDGPPFSEALMPLLGLVNILLGGVALIRYVSSKFQGIVAIHVFRVFLMIYSFLSFAIWMVFFGSRFARYFPIKEFAFYFDFFVYVGRHIFWFLMMLWTGKALKKNPSDAQANLNKA